MQTVQSHYENTPIQMFWKFYNQTKKIFKKKSTIFHIPAKT